MGRTAEQKKADERERARRNRIKAKEKRTALREKEDPSKKEVEELIKLDERVQRQKDKSKAQYHDKVKPANKELRDAVRDKTATQEQVHAYEEKKASEADRLRDYRQGNKDRLNTLLRGPIRNTEEEDEIDTLLWRVNADTTRYHTKIKPEMQAARDAVRDGTATEEQFLMVDNLQTTITSRHQEKKAYNYRTRYGMTAEEYAEWKPRDANGKAIGTSSDAKKAAAKVLDGDALRLFKCTVAWADAPRAAQRAFTIYLLGYDPQDDEKKRGTLTWADFAREDPELAEQLVPAQLSSSQPVQARPKPTGKTPSRPKPQSLAPRQDYPQSYEHTWDSQVRSPPSPLAGEFREQVWDSKNPAARTVDAAPPLQQQSLPIRKHHTSHNTSSSTGGSSGTHHRRGHGRGHGNHYEGGYDSVPSQSYSGGDQSYSSTGFGSTASSMQMPSQSLQVPPVPASLAAFSVSPTPGLSVSPAPTTATTTSFVSDEELRHQARSMQSLYRTQYSDRGYPAAAGNTYSRSRHEPTPEELFPELQQQPVYVESQRHYYQQQQQPQQYFQSSNHNGSSGHGGSGGGGRTRDRDRDRRSRH